MIQLPTTTAAPRLPSQEDVLAEAQRRYDEASASGERYEGPAWAAFDRFFEHHGLGLVTVFGCDHGLDDRVHRVLRYRPHASGGDAGWYTVAYYLTPDEFGA